MFRSPSQSVFEAVAVFLIYNLIPTHDWILQRFIDFLNVIENNWLLVMSIYLFNTIYLLWLISSHWFEWVDIVVYALGVSGKKRGFKSRMDRRVNSYNEEKRQKIEQDFLFRQEMINKNFNERQDIYMKNFNEMQRISNENFDRKTNAILEVIGNKDNNSKKSSLVEPTPVSSGSTSKKKKVNIDIEKDDDES